MSKILVLIFKLLGLMISFFVWAVIGLIVWTFLMVRHFAVLAFKSTLVAFGNVDISNAVANMERAVAFYPSGFVRIIQAFFEDSPPQKHEEFWPPIWRLVTESYAALIFFWLPVSLLIDNEGLNDFLRAAFFPVIFGYEYIMRQFF